MVPMSLEINNVKREILWSLLQHSVLKVTCAGELNWWHMPGQRSLPSPSPPPPRSKQAAPCYHNTCVRRGRPQLQGLSSTKGKMGLIRRQSDWQWCSALTLCF